MRKIILLLAVVVFGLNGLYAQKESKKKKSPLKEVSVKLGECQVDIQYSSPSKRGREIYGELVPFGKVWRTGANQATVIETSKDLMVDGKLLKAGKYGLFTIPNADHWVIIFNSVWDQWGAYKYDDGKDVLRVTGKVSESDSEIEMFDISIANDVLQFSWDRTIVKTAITQ